MKVCINPGSVFAFASGSLGHLWHSANMAGVPWVISAGLKRNTEHGGFIDGIRFSNLANGTVTRKESRAH